MPLLITKHRHGGFLGVFSRGRRAARGEDIYDTQGSKQPARDALGIPEILAVVLSHVDQQDSARCMRVCRRWHETAMRVAWRDLDGVVPICKALRPEYDTELPGRVDDDSGPMEFCTKLTGSDWTRTAPYFESVKSLTILENDEVGGRFFHCWLEIVLSWPTDREVFPNLKRLKLSLDPTYSGCRPMSIAPVFLYDGISHLDITIQQLNTEGPSLPSFLKFAQRATRISNISFRINCPGHLSRSQIDFQRTIPVFKQLRHLSANRALLTPELLSSLAGSDTLEIVEALPDTDTVDFDGGFLFPTLQLDSASSAAVTLPTDTLSRLGHLELFDLLGTSELLFNHATGRTFASLHTLNIASPLGINVAACLPVLPGACPALRELHLSWRGRFRDRDSNSMSGPVGIQLLSHLSKLRYLEEFYLTDRLPVTINDDELHHLVSQCPSLRILHLNPEPFTLDLSTTLLTLRSVTLLSSQCPRLEGLALYLNANITVDSNLPQPIANKSSIRTNGLKKLSFMISPVSSLDTQDILSYLGNHLHPQGVAELTVTSSFHDPGVAM